jgi:hypothetical protein
LTLASRTALVRLIRTVHGGYFRARFESSVIDSLEYLDVELFSALGLERKSQSHESVGESLNTNTDGAMTHVGTTGFRDWVVVDVDDSIEVESYNLGDVMELLKVVFAVSDIGREGK